MESGRLIDDTPVLPVPLERRLLPGAVRTALRPLWRRLRAHRTLVKFAVVGSVGYVVYSGILLLLYDLSALPFLPEREQKIDLGLFTYDDSLLLITTLIGTQASIMAVFCGHTLWTFSEWAVAKKPLWLRFLQFQAKALVSTLGVLTIVVNGLVVGFGLHHYLAVPIGFAASFAWNWIWDSQIIWRKRGNGSEASE